MQKLAKDRPKGSWGQHDGIHLQDEDWTEVPMKTKSFKGKGTPLEADPPPSTPEPPETPPTR